MLKGQQTVSNVSTGVGGRSQSWENTFLNHPKGGGPEVSEWLGFLERELQKQKEMPEKLIGMKRSEKKNWKTYSEKSQGTG